MPKRIMSSFGHHARKVVDPRYTPEARLLALRTCIRKLAWMTYEGYDPKTSEEATGFPAHYRATCARLNRRFGFEDASPIDPHVLIDVLAAVEVERNRMLEVEAVLIQRRLRRKARGIRVRSDDERQAERAYWLEAVRRLQERFPSS